MQTLSTDFFHPYSVQFSPFYGDRLACCANENYGISGSGFVYIFSTQQTKSRRLFWPKGIFDISWSEDAPSHLFACTADGFLLLYNVDDEKLLSHRRVHEKEIYHIDCSASKSGSSSILTSSWDKTLSLFDAQRPDLPLIRRFDGHFDLVYCGVFSPTTNLVFASASRDGTSRIWDTRSPTADVILEAHQAEILSCDWCKYQDMVLATSGTDGSTKIWDLRRGTVPLAILVGHQYAVRCLKWSPYARSQLITCSYDKTVRLWDGVLESPIGMRKHSRVINRHTEFAYGVDYNLHINGQVADCGWDRTVQVYQLSLISAL